MLFIKPLISTLTLLNCNDLGAEASGSQVKNNAGYLNTIQLINSQSLETQPRPSIMDKTKQPISLALPQHPKLHLLEAPISNKAMTQEFYKTLFGFSLDSQEAQTAKTENSNLSMEFDGYKFQFSQDSSTLSHKVGKKMPREITSRVDHWAFQCRSIDDTIAALEAMQKPYKVFKVPGTDTKQIFIHDPDGHALELVFKNVSEAPKDIPAFGRLGVTRFDHASRLSMALSDDKHYLNEQFHLSEIPRPPFPIQGHWLTDGNAEFHLVEGNEQIQPNLSSGDLWVFAAEKTTLEVQVLASAQSGSEKFNIDFDTTGHKYLQL